MRAGRWRLAGVVVAGAMLLLSQPLAAAEIRVIDSRDASSPVLGLSGPIVAGDSGRLAAALRAFPNNNGLRNGRLMLDSPGGDYAEALRLGRIVRDGYLVTRIAAGKSCIGACAFVFIGGGDMSQNPDHDWTPGHALEVGGQLVFEGISRATASADATGSDGTGGSVIGAIHAFLRSLWMDPQFFGDFIALKPGERMAINSAGRLRMLEVSLLGVPWPHTVTDQTLVNLCNWATGWVRPLTFTPADPQDPVAEVTELSYEEFKRDLLVRKLKGVYKEGPLTKRLRETAEQGDATAIDALYAEAADLGILRLSSPSKSDRFFYVTGFDYGGGFYTLSCSITLNLGEPEKMYPNAAIVEGFSTDDIPGTIHHFGLRGDAFYELYERDTVLP